MELVTPNVNITIILPELIVAIAGIIAMVYDSFFPSDRKATGIISLAGLALSAVFLADAWAGGSYLTPLFGQNWSGMTPQIRQRCRLLTS